MGIDLSHQLQVTWGALLLGVLFGFLFLLVRVIGYFLRGAFWRFVMDLGRIVIAVMGSLFYFQQRADGQIRWYDLAAMLLSAWLFHFCVGRFLVAPFCRAVSFVICLAGKFFLFLWQPLGFVFILLGKGFRIITKNMVAFLKKVFIFLKKYIIIKMSKHFNGRKNGKEAPCGRKTEEKKQGSVSQFYH